METFLSRFVRRRPGRAAARRGFSLLEVIAVLAVVGLLAAAGYPALTRILQRERTEGFLRGATIAVERAKTEAAKRNVPSVVRADFARGALFAFADLDRDLALDAGEPQLFFLALPSSGSRGNDLRFWSALEPGPDGSGAVLGFSADPENPAAPRQAVLDPDGSVRASGAFRFGLAGPPGNFYEIRVEPASTARVQLRKYLPDAGAAYLPRDPGGSASWPWF